MRKIFLLFFFSAMCSHALTGQSMRDNGQVKFRIKNFGLAVEGSFHPPTGKMAFDPVHPSDSGFDVTVDVNSITTGIGLRDRHLKGPEYFDVGKFPEIHFVSTSIKKGFGDKSWIVTGNLTIKATTLTVSFPFTEIGNDSERRLQGQFKINRLHFGIGGKSLSLGDEVHVIVNAVY